jgi:hypothetical protein
VPEFNDHYDSWRVCNWRNGLFVNNNHHESWLPAVGSVREFYHDDYHAALCVDFHDD